jgi:hypothetical protein
MPDLPMTVATLVKMLPQEARNSSRLKGFRLNSLIARKQIIMIDVADIEMIDMVLCMVTMISCCFIVKPCEPAGGGRTEFNPGLREINCPRIEGAIVVLQNWDYVDNKV